MKATRAGEALADLHRIVIVTIHLAHQEPVFVGVGDVADRLAEKLDGGLVQLRGIMELPEEGLLVLRQRPDLEFRIGRIVPVGRAVAIDCMDGIETEAVDPRSNQKRATSIIASRTFGLAWFRFGWLGRKL